MKKVSVILTTYNSENTIQRVLDFIKNQKGLGVQFDLEIIVIDDCSKDNTVGILKKNDVVVLSTGSNSGGPNKGRNIGLQHATGDYICIADHDDEWKEDKIISLIPYLEKVPIVTSGYTVIDEKENKRIDRIKDASENHMTYSNNITFLDKLKKSQLGQNTYLGSIIYRSELKDILFEEHFGMVDFDWILRLFYQQPSIEVCKSLYNRYVDGTNLSLDEGYRLKDYEYSLKTLNEYGKEFPKEAKIGIKRTHGSLARYYYLVDEMKKARHYFLKSGLNLKIFMYYVTTFVGSSYVKRKFNVFG